MIWGAGSRNAVAVAQRGASRAFAHLTHTLLPFRAAGYARASVADPRVGAARTIHASCLSCLAAGDASASAADLIIWAARPVHASLARGTTGCATHVGIGTTTAVHAGLTRGTAGCATDLARGTTVPVHAGLARGTATGRAAHLIIRAARPVEAGFARGTTHTGASAGVACEALAAITRSG
jgi:hypothetical protein